MAKCEISSLQDQIQEQQTTTWKDKCIEHKDDDHYIVNLYALHTTTLLEKALPQHLTKPKPIHIYRKLYCAQVPRRNRRLHEKGMQKKNDNSS